MKQQRDTCHMTARYDVDMQLGYYDVPAAVLSASGVPLAELIGEGGASSVDDMMGPPPVNGWRVIAGDLADFGGEPPALAAPWSSPRSNGWMVISVSRLDGVWQASILGDSRPLRPSRARRRAGLTLTWSVPVMSAPVGTVPQLRVRLSSAGDRPWHNDGADYDHVTVQLLRPEGTPLPDTLRGPWNSSDMVGTAVHLLPTLLPGSSVDLTPAWDTAEIPSLPPGDYGIVAELNDLQLRSGPEVLQLSLR
jgi:hypothetical protein